MQTCDPLEARQWFKLREAVNFAVVIGGFIVLDAILWPVAGGFIAGTVSIVVMFCVFFFILHKRTIGIRCPRCQNFIETNTPWICGVCGAHNLCTDDFPFVGRCQKCRAEPKAYQCHHKKCGELIFFTKDRQEINFAKCVNIPVPKRPIRVEKDEHMEEMVKLDKGIQLTERKVKKAELDVKLKEFKDVLEPQKPRTQKDATEESFASFEDRNMTGAEIVRRKKAENAEKYKNDPVKLEQQNRLVDQWGRENLDLM
jgi:hypothetical protein